MIGDSVVRPPGFGVVSSNPLVVIRPSIRPGAAVGEVIWPLMAKSPTPVTVSGFGPTVTGPDRVRAWPATADPKVVAPARVTGPAKVLFPATSRSAPAAPTPVPATDTGSAVP